MVGWVSKIASFDDVQYSIYADLTPFKWVDGSEKVQNYADVIYERSLIGSTIFEWPTKTWLTVYVCILRGHSQTTFTGRGR